MNDEERRALHAADLLDDWADAIRGDWGGIDGRQCRTQLNVLSDYLRGHGADLTAEDIGVCTKGGPHWFDGDCYDFFHEGRCSDRVLLKEQTQ